MGSGGAGLASTNLGMLRTVDGGDTWVETDPGFGASVLAYADARHVWAAGYSGGIWRSDDGGVSWRRQESATDVHLNALAVVDADRAWVAGRGTGFSDVAPLEVAPSVLLRTEDGGMSWRPWSVPGGGTFWDVAFIDGRLWVIGDNCFSGTPYFDSERGVRVECHRAVHVSGDGGTTWQRLASQPATVPETIVAAREEGVLGTLQVCEAGGCGDALVGSEDGGQTWQERSRPESTARYVFEDTRSGWRAALIGCTTRCAIQISRTEDGGRTWRVHSTSPPVGPRLAVVFAANDTRLIVGGGDTGLMVVDVAPAATSAADAPARPYLQQVQFTDDRRGFAIGDLRVWTTSDGGLSWAPLDTDWEAGQLAVDGETLWVLSPDACLEMCVRALRFSVDGGSTWTERPLPPSLFASGMLDAHDGRVWIGLDNSLYWSDDGGMTWQLLETAELSGSYTFIDRDHGYSFCPGFCEDALRFTDDGGVTWELRALPDGGSVVQFLDPVTGWAIATGSLADGSCCGPPHLWRTDDGGRSWQDIGEMPPTNHAVHFADRLHGWAIAFDEYPAPTIGEWQSDIVATRDGGRTWQAEQRIAGFGAFVASGDQVWVLSGTSESPWDPGRQTIYRRAIGAGAAAVSLPDTGKPPASGGPLAASTALCLVAASAALCAGHFCRRLRRRTGLDSRLDAGS